MIYNQISDEDLANVISALKNIGVDEKNIQKALSFTIEQKNFTETLNNNTREKNEVLNQNIFSFRSILITITGFSLTIIGVVVSAIVSNKDVFGNNNILYIGLFCLVLNIIISILFILNIYHFENNKLSKGVKFNNKCIKDFYELIDVNFKIGSFEDFLTKKSVFLKTKTEEEIKIIEEKNNNGLLIGEKDFTPHLSVILFLIGFVLILLSFIKF